MGRLLSKIAWKPSQNLLFLLDLVDSTIMKGRVNPFRTDSDKYDYVMQLGCDAWLKENEVKQ